jgi:hypothetical protein
MMTISTELPLSLPPVVAGIDVGIDEIVGAGVGPGLGAGVGAEVCGTDGAGVFVDAGVGANVKSPIVCPWITRKSARSTPPPVLLLSVEPLIKLMLMSEIINPPLSGARAGSPGTTDSMPSDPVVCCVVDSGN